jgi:uncharacterized delta-60 repeat protein
MKTHLGQLSSLICLAFAACGSDPAARPDAGGDAAAPDAAMTAFTPPIPFAIPLSAAGPDQLQSAVAAPGGAFYAAGFAAATLTGARLVTVVKYSATGLDATFGTAGVVTTAIDFKGGAGEVVLATQPDGKLVVSATVASPIDPADRDVAVVRLLATGALDKTFGVDGVASIDLNAAVGNGAALVGLDVSRGLAASADAIYLHAASRGLGTAAAGGPRLDTDFTVVKLTAGGAIDPTFGTNGQFRLDLGESNANPRAIKLLADGTLLASGYANSPGLGTTQVVLYKLTPAGALEPGFAQGGLFHDTILAVQTEIYGFAVHGDKLVTAGYGRNTGVANDYVSLRFDVTTGARDLTWGGAANGAVLLDPSGAMLGSNCRNAVALPGGKTLLIGSTGPANLPTQDAVLAVLDASGKLDASYGGASHRMMLGKNGNDQFWGGAVSGDQVSVVGYQGGGQAQTEASNDDTYASVFAVR